MNNHDAIWVDNAFELPFMKLLITNMLKSKNLISMKNVREALPLKWGVVMDKKITCLAI